MLELKTELGALVDCPIYSAHKRGKNWLAVIHKDPASPGGLGRSFCKKAHGEYYYMINELKIGDRIEFGADYYSCGGNPTRTRLYGVIREIAEDKIVIEKFETAAKAIASQY